LRLLNAIKAVPVLIRVIRHLFLSSYFIIKLNRARKQTYAGELLELPWNMPKIGQRLSMTSRMQAIGKSLRLLSWRIFQDLKFRQERKRAGATGFRHGNGICRPRMALAGLICG